MTGRESNTKSAPSALLGCHALDVFLAERLRGDAGLQRGALRLRRRALLLLRRQLGAALRDLPLQRRLVRLHIRPYAVATSSMQPLCSALNARYVWVKADEQWRQIFLEAARAGRHWVMVRFVLEHEQGNELFQSL
jgi:hypothetical protein